MPLLADRVRETTTTTGQGTLTLDGAPSGFRTFTGAFGNGASVYYVIAGPSEWEIGFGTTGAGTLTRDTVLVSSAGGTTKVTFSAGTKDVFCSYVADRAVTTSDAATLTNKTIDDYTNNVGANSTHFRIKASGTLAKGTVVKAVGFTPGEQAIEVAATSSASDVALGISEQALTTGQFGMAVVIGELFDVNTNGLAVGATLYSNNAGGYTTTKPSSGFYQSLGWVVRANLNNGVIAVNVVAPLYVETSTNTANTAVLRDGSGNFAAGTITQTTGLFGNGTAGAPALAASADTNTGIYFPAADTLGFVEGGVESMRLNSAGDLLIGSSTAPSSSSVRLLLAKSGNSFLQLTRTAGTIGGGLIGTVGQNLEFYTHTGGVGSEAYEKRWEINASGHWLANFDTTFDIGASGANRPRDLFLGRNATVAGNLTVDTNTLFVDATNNRVGVGTTSPVGSGSSLNISVSGGVSQLLVSDTGDATDQKHWTWQTGLSVGAGVFRLRSLNDALTDGRNAYILTRSGMEIQTHQWLTANTERMRLDASGNLGLGVTPSAWTGWGSGVLQILTSVLSNDASNNTYLTSNTRYDSGSGTGWRYIASDWAMRYDQVEGAHRWFSAPSGTAGNAITFTQAMTLDASGNLGIGTTSPSARLNVYQTATTVSATIASDAGRYGVVTLATGTGADSTTRRWIFGKNDNAESGSNGGSNLELLAYGDTGSLIDTVFRIARASGGSILFGRNVGFLTDATYDIGASGANRPRDLFLSRNMVGGGWMRAGAASAGAASTTTIGSTTSTTVGASGSASALPANPLGYIVAHVGTTEVRIPYYNA